jgi:hypothetical protein
MKKVNIVLGSLLVVFALAAGILPAFTDCWSQGRSLTTTTGKTVPMKCHWTAIAELSIAIPLGLSGIFMVFGKHNETRRVIGALGIVLGALVILLPTTLIGVCANPAMDCNKIMKPGLILTGGLAIATCLVILFNSRKLVEPAE